MSHRIRIWGGSDKANLHVEAGVVSLKPGMKKLTDEEIKRMVEASQKPDEAWGLRREDLDPDDTE